MNTRRANISGNDRLSIEGNLCGATNFEHAPSSPVLPAVERIELACGKSSCLGIGETASTGAGVNDAGHETPAPETVSPELAAAIDEHLDAVFGAARDLAAVLLDDLADMRDALCTILLYEADPIGSIQ